jgi:hypothetical protein
MLRSLVVFLCILAFFISGCEPKPVLKNALQNHSLGVLSVVWNPLVQVEGRAATVVLGPRHTGPLTDAFLQGLVNVSNSWVRDASSRVLQNAFTFYPDAPPPKKDGMALSVIDGYKWVLLQTPAVALHWCDALSVDTVLTAVLTPYAVFSKDDVAVTVVVELTVFNRQEGRIYSDTLRVPIPLSKEAVRWIVGDPRRLPDMLVSSDVLLGLLYLYPVAPDVVSTANVSPQ